MGYLNDAIAEAMRAALADTQRRLVADIERATAHRDEREPYRTVAHVGRPVPEIADLPAETVTFTVAGWYDVPDDQGYPSTPVTSSRVP